MNKQIIHRAKARRYKKRVWSQRHNVGRKIRTQIRVIPDIVMKELRKDPGFVAKQGQLKREAGLIPDKIELDTERFKDLIEKETELDLMKKNIHRGYQVKRI